MQDKEKILLNQDKLYVAFLWLLSLVSLHFLYVSSAFVRQIPFGKGIAGIAMLTSEAFLIIMAVRAYKEHSAILHPLVKVIVLLAISYNFAHIIYTLMFVPDVPYLSLFGNIQYQPLFMLPIALLIGLEGERFFNLYKFIWYYVMLMVPLFIFARVAETLAGTGLLFLLAFARYLPNKKRVFLLVFVALYTILCYTVDARAPLIRAMMGVAIWVFSYTPLCKSRIVKMVIYIIIVALPLYYLIRFASTGESILEQLTSSSYVADLGEEHSADTRTFLYEEVFDDLTNNDAWVFGKSITGTYYSDYFDNKYSNEKEYRFGAEVGVLYFLLKGGLVQFVLYMLILLIAIYRCLFFSKSRYAVLIGLVLLSHYVLLFIEDIPRYDLYNIAMWIFTGLAFAVTKEECGDDWFEERFNSIFKK